MMGTIRPPDRCRTAAGRGFSFAPQDSNTPSLGEAGFEDEGRTRSGLSRPTPGGEPLGSVASLSVGSKRLPGTSRVAAVLWAVVSPQQTRRDGQNIALGHSREPPAIDR
jgi:hypothetical protein